MQLWDLHQEPEALKLVDAVPTDCGARKRRRPTNGTEETEHCSDDDLSEVVLIALSDEDSQSADQQLGTTRGSAPAPVLLDAMADGMDLSMDKLLRSSTSCSSTSSSRLAALLEENQRTIQSLLAKEETMLNATKTQTTAASALATATSLREVWQFELEESLPGIAAMLLYCVAHASTYELVSNLAYEAVERAPEDGGTHSSPWGLYTTMLLVGCVLARFSGLVWNFTGPKVYQRVKLIYHNRIRLGAKDARWLHWLNEQDEGVLGMVTMVAYYLCYIAVVFFVGQLAVYCDQRREILGDLPSALYKQELASMEEAANLTKAAAAWFQNSSAACLRTVSHDDELEFFGPEDDRYFYRVLSKNSYDHFFGQDYDIPLFDATHQIFFYASLAVTAVYTLKSYMGFSFWAGW